MNRNIVAAIILALGLIVASICAGGIYQFTERGSDPEALYRFNRITGEILVCAITGDNVACFRMPTDHLVKNVPVLQVIPEQKKTPPAGRPSATP